MEKSDDTLSIVLFSGTDDRLGAAATLVAGAAAVGRGVHVLLQNWALDAFRKGALQKDHGSSFEAGIEGAGIVLDYQSRPNHHWSFLLEQAKDIGDVSISACAQSMDLLELDIAELDPIVDDVEGVAAFLIKSTGQMLFV